MGVSHGGRGTKTERRVEDAAELMDSLGIAYLRKQATPRAWDGTNIGKAPIDFIGVLASGEAVFVEVKEERGATLSLGEMRIKPHQRAALDSALRWTTHVYLLASFFPRAATTSTARRSFVWFLIPWAVAQHLNRIDPLDGQLWEYAAEDLFLKGVAARRPGGE